MRTLARLTFALPLALAACSAGTPPAQQPGSGAKPVAVAGDDPAQVAAAEGDARPESSQWLGVAGESGAMMPGTHETFLGVWVDVPSRAVGHAPLATSVVVDTSGSMAGEKIVHARASAKRFIDGLKDGDIASLVSFDDTARELVPPTVLGAASRVRFAGAVSELRADGATNLFEGIRLGGMNVMSAPATHSVRRIVLVSDGIATAGPTSREILGAIADKAADRGVQVTAVGVGLDYDEATLNDVAMRSSGRLYHVGNTSQLASMLEQEMKLLRGTRAANAFVDVMPAAGVTLTGVDGTRTQMRDGGGLRIPIGALFAGQRKEFLVRARVDAPSAGSHPIASVRLHFSDPSEGNLERVQEAVARYEVTNDAGRFATLKDERVQGIWSLAEASKATQRAAEQIDGDRFDDAERDLAAVEKKLQAQAAVSKDAKTKARIEDNARMVGQARASAGGAAKAPAAAKPAAKRAAKLEANDAAMDSAGY
jgi:Ca-activated chloride channel family protein